MMASLVKYRVEGLLPSVRLTFFGRFYSTQSVRDNSVFLPKRSSATPRFIPPKNTISPFIVALSRYYKTPPALGLQGKYATLVRELSEFGDTVGVLDAHSALIRRNVPFHFDVFQTMLHHFARIGDLDECLHLLHGALNGKTGGERNAEAKTGGEGNTEVKTGGEANAETNKTRPTAAFPRKRLYNALLLALIENKRWEWCDQVLEEMDKFDVHWDEATCLLMARMRLQSGHPEQMKDVLKHARARGVFSNAVYNYVLMHTTEENEIQKIKKEMHDREIAVNDVSSHPLLSVATPSPASSLPQPSSSPKFLDTQPPTDPLQTGQNPPTDSLQTEQTGQNPTDQLQTGQNPPTDPLQTGQNPPTDPLQTGQNPPTDPLQTGQILPTDSILPPLPFPPPAVLPSFPMPYSSAMYPAYPYPVGPPPSFSGYPEFYTAPAPAQDRIVLSFPAAPLLPPTPTPPVEPRQQRPIFATREEYHQAIANSPKERRQSLLRDMLRAKITPDESTMKVVMSASKAEVRFSQAASAWNDFASANCGQILPKLIPFLVPDPPFDWKGILAGFRNNSIFSPPAYDELLTKMARPGAVQDLKDLLTVMTELNVAASKEAIASILSSVLGDSLQELEAFLSWLMEHGAFLDHTVYCDLAQRIAQSPSPALVKRDAILFLHRTMKQRRMVPDYAFFATAFHCIMACRDPEPCAAMLLSMKSAGVRMDQPLYSLLTVFLLRCGEVALAEQVDEDMRAGATDLQVALHYGYLRAFQDRGELVGVEPNTVIPGLEVYYQQQSSPHPLRFPFYPLPPPTPSMDPSLPFTHLTPPFTNSTPPLPNPTHPNKPKRLGKDARRRARERAAGQSTQSTQLTQPTQSTQPPTPITQPTQSTSQSTQSTPTPQIADTTGQSPIPPSATQRNPSTPPAQRNQSPQFSRSKTPPTQNGNTSPTQNKNTLPNQNRNTSPSQNRNTSPTQNRNASLTRTTSPNQNRNTSPTQNRNTSRPPRPTNNNSNNTTTNTTKNTTTNTPNNISNNTRNNSQNNTTKNMPPNSSDPNTPNKSQNKNTNKPPAFKPPSTTTSLVHPELSPSPPTPPSPSSPPLSISSQTPFPSLPSSTLSSSPVLVSISTTPIPPSVSSSAASP